MKVLPLILKRKWFDMIVSGEKKEEYREIKPYWITRLTCGTGFISEGPASQHNGLVPVFIHFDMVSARNGYARNCPLVIWKHKSIRIGKPNPAWCELSDAGKDCFILEIGDLISYREKSGITWYGDDIIKMLR